MLRTSQFTLFCGAFIFLMLLHRLNVYLRDPTSQSQQTPSLVSPVYQPGEPKANGLTYSKTLVVAKMENENVSWIEDSKTPLNKAIYVVDNPKLSPGFEVPKNKGHEAMVYLTYIIDHYDTLADVSIFVHSHQTTWHNNDLLDSDMLKTVEHLSEAHVFRQGYFNLRCHHEPGCPDWLHIDRPDDQLDTYRKMEEKTFSLAVWNELHPNVEAPHAISQPCCAQFAVSKERIRANPRSEYIRYREWLENTALTDTYSGRIMEYSWQYLFAGVAELCPAMNVCYCDGYGICFGGGPELESWFDTKKAIIKLSSEAEAVASEPENEQKVRQMREKIDEMTRDLWKKKDAAFDRGKDPKLRAQEVGRPWKEGDGF